MKKLKSFFFLMAVFAVMGFSWPWPFSVLFHSSVPHSPAPVLHSPAPVLHSPAPVLHSPAPVLHSPVLLHSPENPSAFAASWFDQRIAIIHSQAGNLDTQILRMALKAYVRAHHQLGHDKQVLTIIDYSKPSTERRLWVIDLHYPRVLYNTWVTHGVNSGGLNATSFSNQPGSLKSSLGVFVTESTYVGKVGYAVHLKGLEPGFNDNAYRRAVVVHGAWYADQNIAKRYGRLGRSFGCLAVSDKIAKSLINTIKDTSVVFAYYPDRQWLRRSSYLA